MRTVDRTSRELASFDLLSQLFQAFREHDDSAFRRVAKNIIDDEIGAKNHSRAKVLQDALGAIEKKSNGHTLAALPKDRRFGSQLFEIHQPCEQQQREPLLATDARRQIARVIDERRNQLKLASHGYKPKSRLLFWGPPGCGKTMTAHYLATQLQLPVALVRWHAVVSSFLGESTAHLQQLFDAASHTPMVLLLDEFDTVGKDRDDPNDVGELKRIVNGLLQAMDSFRNTESLVIAASNHQYLLDPAIWRRFDDVICFPFPTQTARLEFVHDTLNGIVSDLSHEVLAKKFNGRSFADIERVLIEAVKTAILDDRDRLTQRDLSEQLALLKRTTAALRRPSSRSHE